MNYQKEIPKELQELYKQKFGSNIWDYSYYAWPYMFGSTAGPHGGMGRAVMSMFTIECYYDDEKNISLLFCDGEYDFVEGFFKIHDSLATVKWKRVKITSNEEVKSNVMTIRRIQSTGEQLNQLTNPKNPE